jgi:probable phosphoglycerate mutase
MRHGESVANISGLIISDPKVGCNKYGLTTKGATQAHDSVIGNIELSQETLIFASDFLRTIETAEIAQNILKIPEIILETRLRERYFGEYDGTQHENYEKVFEFDQKDHTHSNFGVESVENVITRTTSLIDDIENQYVGKSILLVSHGDPLHILFACFTGIHPTDRFKFLNFKNAEIRRMHNDPYELSQHERTKSTGRNCENNIFKE